MLRKRSCVGDNAMLKAVCVKFCEAQIAGEEEAGRVQGQ